VNRTGRLGALSHRQATAKADTTNGGPRPAKQLLLSNSTEAGMHIGCSEPKERSAFDSTQWRLRFKLHNIH
jgi:hypothetical protein